jgi:hypothetical protein
MRNQSGRGGRGRWQGRDCADGSLGKVFVVCEIDSNRHGETSESERADQRAKGSEESGPFSRRSDIQRCRYTATEQFSRLILAAKAEMKNLYSILVQFLFFTLSATRLQPHLPYPELPRAPFVEAQVPQRFLLASNAIENVLAENSAYDSTGRGEFGGLKGDKAATGEVGG